MAPVDVEIANACQTLTTRSPTDRKPITPPDGTKTSIISKSETGHQAGDRPEELGAHRSKSHEDAAGRRPESSGPYKPPTLF